MKTAPEGKEKDLTLKMITAFQIGKSQMERRAQEEQEQALREQQMQQVQQTQQAQQQQPQPQGSAIISFLKKTMTGNSLQNDKNFEIFLDLVDGVSRKTVYAFMNIEDIENEKDYIPHITQYQNIKKKHENL